MAQGDGLLLTRGLFLLFPGVRSLGLSPLLQLAPWDFLVRSGVVGLDLGSIPTSKADLGSAPAVYCFVPRAGLEMPLAPQAQDLVGNGAGQAAGRPTPRGGQPGGAQEEGQQQDVNAGDAPAEPDADPNQIGVQLERALGNALANQQREFEDRTSSYLQEIRNYLLEQGQKVASLEKQSSSKTG